jgi:hypothetical protein
MALSSAGIGQRWNLVVIDQITLIRQGPYMWTCSPQRAYYDWGWRDGVNGQASTPTSFLQLARQPHESRQRLLVTLVKKLNAC